MTFASKKTNLVLQKRDKKKRDLVFLDTFARPKHINLWNFFRQKNKQQQPCRGSHQLE